MSFCSKLCYDGLSLQPSLMSPIPKYRLAHEAQLCCSCNVLFIWRSLRYFYMQNMELLLHGEQCKCEFTDHWQAEVCPAQKKCRDSQEMYSVIRRIAWTFWTAIMASYSGFRTNILKNQTRSWGPMWEQHLVKMAKDPAAVTQVDKFNQKGEWH